MSYGVLGAGVLLLPAGNATSQTIEGRHWQGATAITRQPEQVVAGTITEWRSLWGRVGSPAPDMFEPGRMNAVGIFLGRRAGEGYSVNILSTSRRRDRIVVVFEERMPAEFMMAQRAPAPSSPRPVAIAPSAPSGFAGGAGAGFAPSGTGANSGASPAARDPSGRPADVAVGDHPDPALRPADLRRAAAVSLGWRTTPVARSATNASAAARPWSRRSSDS